MEDVGALVSFATPLGLVLIMVLVGWDIGRRLVALLDKHFLEMWQRFDRWLDGKENGRIK